MSATVSVTCDFDLCDGAIAALRMCPDLHHVVSVFGPGQVYGLFAGVVQSSLGVSLLPDQDLGEERRRIPPMSESGTSH